MPSKNDRSESGAQALADALRQRSNGASGRPFPTLPHEPDKPKQLPHQPATSDENEPDEEC